MFTSQQLSGEEDSRRKHCTSLQRPAPQARVSKVAAQIEGIPAHRYSLKKYIYFFLNVKNFFMLGASSKTIPSFSSTTVNSAGETALDAARRLQHLQCVDLVRRFLIICSLNSFSISWATWGGGYFHDWIGFLVILPCAAEVTPRIRNSILIRPRCASFINKFYFLTGHLPL